MLDTARVETIRSGLPELPDARRERFVAEYGLPIYDATLLTNSKELADYFERFHMADRTLSTKNISNWLLGPASAIMNANNSDITKFNKRVSPERFVRLASLESQGVINTATAKSVLEEMYNTEQEADAIINKQGLSQIGDKAEIEAEVVGVIKSNSKAVADYRVGKTQSIKFLVGQVMKATRGRANPNLVNEILKQKLEEV